MGTKYPFLNRTPDSIVYWPILARRARTSFLSDGTMPSSKYLMMGVIQLSPSSSTIVCTSWTSVNHSLRTLTNISLVRWWNGTVASLL
ncbi:hypothetical protein Tco_0398875, partial [Tanacetum coccineum]